MLVVDAPSWDGVQHAHVSEWERDWEQRTIEALLQNAESIISCKGKEKGEGGDDDQQQKQQRQPRQQKETAQEDTITREQPITDTLNTGQPILSKKATERERIEMDVDGKTWSGISE